VVLALQAERVVRFELRRCPFCDTRAAHDVVKSGGRLLAIAGPPTWGVRIVKSCRRCGGQRQLVGARHRA
jgi:hypothetical protein